MINNLSEYFLLIISPAFFPGMLLTSCCDLAMLCFTTTSLLVPQIAFTLALAQVPGWEGKLNSLDALRKDLFCPFLWMPKGGMTCSKKGTAPPSPCSAPELTMKTGRWKEIFVKKSQSGIRKSSPNLLNCVSVFLLLHDLHQTRISRFYGMQFGWKVFKAILICSPDAF